MTYYVPKDQVVKACYNHYNVYGYAVEIDFNQFLKHPDQVEAKGILQYAKKPDTTPFDLVIKKATVNRTPEGQQRLQAILVVPSQYQNQVHHHTKLVIALRIRVDTEHQHYFPYPLRESGERYMGTRFLLHRTDHDLQEKDDQKIIFDTLAKLSQEDTW